MVLGAGPIGDMATRTALHDGPRVIVVDQVAERLDRLVSRAAEVINLDAVDDLGEEVRWRTAGRGADAVINAVGMQEHGDPFAVKVIKAVGLVPNASAASQMKRAGINRGPHC